MSQFTEKSTTLLFCQPEAEPEVEHITVSDITPHSFKVTWTAPEAVFDSFALKVLDSSGLGRPHQISVSGDKRTEAVTGLNEDTDYEIELFGIILGRKFQPIFTVARTGIWIFKTSWWWNTFFFISSVLMSVHQ